MKDKWDFSNFDGREKMSRGEIANRLEISRRDVNLIIDKFRRILSRRLIEIGFAEDKHIHSLYARSRSLHSRCR